MMQECTVQSRGWGLLMLRWVVDMDLTSAPEKPEFLFFRVYTEAAVSCHVSASGSLNVTGSGERRCLLRASLERNLTEKSHKTSFKEQAEIACLSSSASLSHRHPPPPHLTLPLIWNPLLLNSHQMEAHGLGMATFARQSPERLHGCLHLVDCQWPGRGGGVVPRHPRSAPSSL